MSEAHKATDQKRPDSLGLGALRVSYQGIESWEMYDLDGNPKKSKKMAYGELLLPVPEYSAEDTLYPVTEEFDEACDMEGGLTGDFEDYSPQSLKKLLRLALFDHLVMVPKKGTMSSTDKIACREQVICPGL